MQSVALAAVVPAPPDIPSGASTNLTLIAAEEYRREVKKRRVDHVPTATHDDICAAEVRFSHSCTITVSKSIVAYTMADI